MKTYCMNGKVNGLIYLASVTGESGIHVAYNCVSGGTKINSYVQVSFYNSVPRQLVKEQIATFQEEC